MDNIILVVITSLISGLLATVVTIIFQKKSELRKSKKEIFETLMACRYAMYIKESVNALNKIDVVFYSNKEVVAAWKEFKKEALRAGENKDQANILQDKQLKLLESMGKVLGYKDINWEDIKDFYYPNGLATQMQEETMLRKAQLQSIIQPNTQAENTQLNQSEQMGMAVIMKLLGEPDGIKKLAQLTEMFGKDAKKKK